MASNHIQKPGNTSTNVTHILTPFNGMHSGFSPDGTPQTYFASVSRMNGITDFVSQSNSSTPHYKFGFIGMVYDYSPAPGFIKTDFSLPQTQEVTIYLTATTNVENSTFIFNLNGTVQTKTMAKGDNQVICVTFRGSETGSYDLVITPKYNMDTTTFLLTEIKIETN